MPELPEVETIKSQLNRSVKGLIIKSVKLRFAKKVTPKNFSNQIIGKNILNIERRAKVLILRLSDNLTLLVHLKMTGKLLLKKPGEKADKHTHAIFDLGDKELHWNDVRKFGWLKLMSNQKADEWLLAQKFGPEPLAEGFRLKHFIECIRARPKSKIKQVIMDQKCIVGIGNIYATEALWQARIHPLQLVDKIDDASLRKLYNALISVLRKAVAARGSSSDNYLDLYGKTGTYVAKHKAYGRAGEPCSRCKTKLQKIRIGGRGTAFCPHCQAKI